VKVQKSIDKEKKGAIIPAPPVMVHLPENYHQFLSELKRRIVKERIKAVMSANAAMVILYWDIGNAILKHQKKEGWGTKVIDRLSHDLKVLFPDMGGFSPRNLKYMRKFAEVWPTRKIVQEVLAQISWFHNLALIEKLSGRRLRLWYAQEALNQGWSRNTLVFQIESALHNRVRRTTNNFRLTLPPNESDMANQIFKDPYLFDFLGTDAPRREAELEQKLIDHIQHFLLELGQGFAFVGRKLLLEVGDREFFPDLVFYHLKLRRYVVIELKIGEFKPSHIGQLNLYLNVVDDILRHPDDKPTIGLLLVKDKNRTIVEYALSGIKKPIGVAKWERQITQSLPEELKSSLPTIEEIEAELEGS
jgi:predicted nuclease of restriction endonuclease-like (RecB) superfamily